MTRSYCSSTEAGPVSQKGNCTDWPLGGTARAAVSRLPVRLVSAAKSRPPQHPGEL